MVVALPFKHWFWMVSKMAELLERRVTRSLSSELQSRAQQAQAPHSNPPFAPAASRANPTHRADLDGSPLDPPPYCRTTSEEIFIHNVVDGAVAIPLTPSMDCLGFPTFPLASRRDSEELFNSWLSNQEAHDATTSPHQTRQASGRFEGGEKFSTALDVNTQALPWFQHTQRMTRSQSAEQRRLHAAMQGPTSFPSTDRHQQLATQGTHGLNPAVASIGSFAQRLADGGVSGNLEAMINPPQSFDDVAPAVRSGNVISNMVSLLKGSLENKKFNEVVDQESHHQRFLGVSSCGKVPGPLHPAMLGHTSIDMGTQNGGQVNMGAITSSGHLHSAALTRAGSPCESSGGAQGLSTGVAVSDGPSTMSAHHNILKRTMLLGGAVDKASLPLKKLNNKGSLHSSVSQRSGDGSYENISKASLGKKPAQLTRTGSLISSGDSGFGLSTNPTKMRRVERREKMLEAKGRSVVPSDMQVAIKRCDALEKEVRSLKLTLSFMNRKDSEQTKQIEELEKENWELQHEKHRLLQEVERLSSA